MFILPEPRQLSSLFLGLPLRFEFAVPPPDEVPVGAELLHLVRIGPAWAGHTGEAVTLSPPILP